MVSFLKLLIENGVIKMNILEIAQQHGAEYHHSLSDDAPVIFDRAKDLQTFAAAVIEDYKASLVPVNGVVIRENLPTLLMNSGIKDSDTRLYALPKETK